MAATKTAGQDGAAFRNDADAVALSLVACVAAGRARGAIAGEAPRNHRFHPGRFALRVQSLYSSHQDQNNNDDQDDPERPAGIVAPAA